MLRINQVLIVLVGTFGVTHSTSAQQGSINLKQSNVLVASAENPPKPNVIVILADNLGIVDMNAYASKFTGTEPSQMFYQTPNLDRLTKEGLAFSQTSACHLCSPARASLLTGKYAARTGFTTAVGGNVRTFYNQAITPPAGYVAQEALVWEDKIDIQQALLNGTTRDALASGQPSDNGQNETTLAEAMTDHQSAFTGKWHLRGHGSQGWQPADQGFEEIRTSTRADRRTSIGETFGIAAQNCIRKHPKTDCCAESPAETSGKII